MSHYDLIDIENRIINDLSDSCDLNQEAAIYISRELDQSAEFGKTLVAELHDNLNQYSQTIQDINQTYSLNYLDGCKTFFIKLNLMSLKPANHHPVLSRFTSMILFSSGKILTEHKNNLTQLEMIHTGIHEAHAKNREIALSYNAFLDSCIQLLAQFDKQILLGKCIIETLRKDKTDPAKNIARKTLKKRVFTLELEKNTPMQIITRLQIIHELYEEYFSVFNQELYANFILFQQKYLDIIRLRENQINTIHNTSKNGNDPDFDNLCNNYNKILTALRSLIILDEDIKEKTDDFEETIACLCK